MPLRRSKETKWGCGLFNIFGKDNIDKNLIHEEMKRRLNSGNACCHSVQNLLPTRMLSKNLNIRIYKNIILPLVLYRYETWSLTLSKENRELRRILVAKRNEMVGNWRQLLNEEFGGYKYDKNDDVKEYEMDRACSAHKEEEECV
jgi:hypothetical protein